MLFVARHLVSVTRLGEDYGGSWKTTGQVGRLQGKLEDYTVSPFVVGRVSSGTDRVILHIRYKQYRLYLVIEVLWTKE